MSEYNAEPTRAELVSFGTPEVAERSYDEATQTQGLAEVVEESAQPSEEVVVPTQEVAPTAEVVTEQDVQEEGEASAQEKMFREMFEKTFGIPPEDLKAELEQSRIEKQRSEAEKELNRLKDSWNVDDDGLSHRLELIKKRMEKLPDAARDALDNYEGINILWNAIVAESGGAANPLPTYERNSVVTPQQARPMFTREQLRAMSPQEYRQRNDEILYAYQNGLVV